MENIEYMACDEQLSYWEQKLINARLEEDYWKLKIQKLKEE